MNKCGHTTCAHVIVFMNEEIPETSVERVDVEKIVCLYYGRLQFTDNDYFIGNIIKTKIPQVFELNIWFLYR
jgi:hypothetical protein